MRIFLGRRNGSRIVADAFIMLKTAPEYATICFATSPFEGGGSDGMVFTDCGESAPSPPNPPLEGEDPKLAAMKPVARPAYRIAPS